MRAGYGESEDRGSAVADEIMPMDFSLVLCLGRLLSQMGARCCVVML